MPTSDWTVPTGTDPDHPEWGKLDQISIHDLPGRTRIHPDWLPFAPGTFSPPRDASWPLAGATDDGVPHRLESLTQIRGWELLHILGPSELTNASAITGLHVSPDDRLLLAGGFGVNQLICLTSGRRVPFHPPPPNDSLEWPYDFGFTRDGDIFSVWHGVGRDLVLRHRLADGPTASGDEVTEPAVDRHTPLGSSLQRAALEHGWARLPRHDSVGDLMDAYYSWIGVTAARDGTLFVSQHGIGRLLRPDRPAEELFSTGDAHIQGAAFTRDGSLLAVGRQDAGISLFRIGDETAEPIATLRGPRGSLPGIAFSADGRWLASGGGDRVIRLWDVQTHECVARFRGHGSTVTAVAFLRFQPLLISGTDEGAIRIWNIDSREAYSGPGHEGKVRDAGFSADARTLITGGKDATAIVWNVDDGTVRYRLEKDNRSIHSVAITPNGQVAFTGGADKKIRVWNLTTGACERVLTGHDKGVMWLRHHPRENLLLSVDGDYEAIVWNAAGVEVARFRAGVRSNRPSQAYRIDAVEGGFRVVVGTQSPVWWPAGRKAKVPTQERLIGFNDAFEAAGEVAVHKEVSPDGRRVAVTTRRGLVVIFDRPADQVPKRYRTAGAKEKAAKKKAKKKNAGR